MVERNISPESIKEYVRVLLGTFTPGKKFHGDLTLATLAASFTNMPGKFYQKFIEDLSSLTIAELPFTPKIARLALIKRKAILPAVTTKKFSMSSPLIVPTVFIENCSQESKKLARIEFSSNTLFELSRDQVGAFICQP